MERIKKFTSFFESAKTQKGGKNSNVCIMELSNDETYGTPTLVYRKYDPAKIKDHAVGIEEIWDNYIEADHGPVYGSDCWHHLTDAIEEYLNSENEEEKEENLSGVETWMGHFGIKDHSAEDLINDSDLVDKYFDKYLIPVRQEFEMVPYWNYIVISPQEIKVPSETPLELGYTTFKEIYASFEFDFGKGIEVFAYNGDDPYIYYFSKDANMETNSHLISTGIKRGNYTDIASLIAETFLAEDARFMTRIPLDIAQKVYDIKGWDKEILKSLKGLDNFGFF